MDAGAGRHDDPRRQPFTPLHGGARRCTCGGGKRSCKWCNMALNAAALAGGGANLCLGVCWTCYHTARACGGPQRGRPYNTVPRGTPVPASDIELA